MSLETRSLKVSVTLSKVCIDALELEGPPDEVKKDVAVSWYVCIVLGLEASSAAGVLALVILALYILLTVIEQDRTMLLASVEIMLQVKTVTGVA